MPISVFPNTPTIKVLKNTIHEFFLEKCNKWTEQKQSSKFSSRGGLGGKMTTMFKHSCLLPPLDWIPLGLHAEVVLDCVMALPKWEMDYLAETILLDNIALDQTNANRV